MNRVETEPEANSPRRTQLDSGFVERGDLRLKRLQRAAVIELFPWGVPFSGKPEPKQAPKERRDSIRFARNYQALLDSASKQNTNKLVIS